MDKSTSQSGDDALSDGEETNQSVWIEMRQVKGSEHEFGTLSLGKALLSLQKGGTEKNPRNYYKEMTLVKPNDIVLHLTENEAFTGISRVAQ